MIRETWMTCPGCRGNGSIRGVFCILCKGEGILFGGRKEITFDEALEELRIQWAKELDGATLMSVLCTSGVTCATK